MGKLSSVSPSSGLHRVRPVTCSSGTPTSRRRRSSTTTIIAATGSTSPTSSRRASSLPRDLSPGAGHKKSLRALTFIAAWILFMHGVELYWFIMPYAHHGMRPSWQDFAAFLTVGSILGFAYVQIAASASLFPTKDPRMVECLTITIRLCPTKSFPNPRSRSPGSSGRWRLCPFRGHRGLLLAHDLELHRLRPATG